MKEAIVIAREGSDDQQQTNLNAQVKLLETYAESAGLTIVQTIARVGMSASEALGLLVDSVRQHAVKVVIVERIDRLLRNLNDFALIDDLVKKSGLEIHLAETGQVLRKNSEPQDKLIQGLHAVIARNYIKYLSEESLKGQIVKAEKGQFPGRAPYGYTNDQENRTIIPHPINAEVVKLVFTLCSERTDGAVGLKKAVLEQTGELITNTRLVQILQSRFYLGVFIWGGHEYQGTHKPLVDAATFGRVQTILSAAKARKKRKGEDK